jgi:1-aminocyclopropane-1-carboxylate deaminase/D-cysteine desulfhydrase-like pyridoxal-dependent ACC family enzyme
MCDDISNKYTDIEKIKMVKDKFKNNINNPPIFIQRINVLDKNINIIQDGVLITGTKQRVVTLFLKKILKTNPLLDTFVYAGSLNGFGALATAYGAKKLGLKAIVFLSTNTDHIDNQIYTCRQIVTLQALGAQIYVCKNWNEARSLEYKTSEDRNGIRLDNFYVCPMGLNDDDGIMIKLLSKQIKKAIKNTILKNSTNTRIWLVSGSGGIAMSIHKALPKATLFIKLTGGYKYKKKVYDWAKNKDNIFILNDEFDKDKNNDSHLYYSSVKNYDDLIFPYVKKYGNENDFIWNVASDDFI